VISFNYYEEISAIILLVILAVASVDLLVGAAAPPRHRRARGRELMARRDVASWRERMPEAFGASPGRRAARIAGGALFFAWLAGALWWFDFSPARLWNGLSGLGTILRLMVPPSPGEMWLDILRGLAESVAMAFLGTFVAALLAVPLGFLGAGNVVTNVCCASRCGGSSTGCAAWTSSSGR
jgi:hypothetical protein